MAWTKEFDEILKGVLRRSDPSLLDSEEIAAVAEIVEKGFEAVKNDENVNSLLGNIDTSNLADDEFEVVHYVQRLADEDYHNRVERHAHSISSPDYLGLRDEGFSHDDAVARMMAVDEITAADAMTTAERPTGNEAAMARLLVDEDDENDPVPYKDEVASDHKYAHPNYGGIENPEYEFFDVFRMAGQKEGVYSMDVPLPPSAGELFEDEPESHVPNDRSQNYFRLEITIDKDGHPHRVLDGSEGDGLDEHLFDVYNASIRAEADKYARNHGLITDESQSDMEEIDGDWNDYDTAPEYVNPANAEWADIHETERVPPEGISLRETNGQMVASVVVPESLSKMFDLDTLDARGVPFDDQDRVELLVKMEGGQLELDRQFAKNSYQGRFEDSLFAHHRDALQQDADHQATEAIANQRRVEDSIAVAAHSDFEGNSAQQRHLDVRVDDQDFTVVATFDENGRVSALDVDPDQIGFDPALDGGNRYRELTSLLDTVREPIAQRVQEYNDNMDEHILVDTGWTESRTLAAGYCVIPEAEIDRVADDTEASGRYLSSGDFHTAEGYPIRLDFDIKGNLEAAVIPGTKTSLKPVLEGSRDHFVEAKAQLADHGIVLSKADSGDYRIDYHQSSSNHRDGEFGSAQFADTVTQATEIGHKMAADRENQTLRTVAQDTERERMVA